MAAPSFSLAMSPHRNVLEADPETDESKQKLVDELQSRGRAAVGGKQWMDAKLLYEKALSISTVDNEKKAIFYSNLSLVEKNMGQIEKAKNAAEAATRENDKYVKGHWRLGQALIALNRPQEALGAFSDAKVLDSTNKLLIKEIQKAEKLVEEKKITDDANAAMSTMVKPSTKATTVIPAKTMSTSSSSVRSVSRYDNAKTDAEKEKDDDSKLFTKSEAIRGYKIINGKKTSYFHNELDEKSKALIGDIAPKKIENPITAVASDKNSKIPGTSQWNEAGTWEERDVTNWAKETLTKSILESRYKLPASSPAPLALVHVEKIKKLEGHASVVVVRGKTRFIYEFSCQLEWRLQKDDDDLSCEGTLAIPDIDGTVSFGEGYEIHDFKIDSASNSSVKPVVSRFVHRGGFSEVLTENIDSWVRLFREKYSGA